MNRIKQISVIALLLLLVGTGGSIITFNFIDNSTDSVEQEMDAKNITNIEISAHNERVELISTNDQAIKVELTGKRTRNLEDRLEVDSYGDTLTIETEEERKLFNINFFGESRELTIYLPAKDYELLQVGIENGSLQASNLNIKEIHTETDNGHVEMDDMTANDVQIYINNGKVDLDGVQGNISGESNNGSFSLTTSNLDRNIEWEANNGKIEIETEKEPTNATLDLKTTNGKATVFGNSNWDSVVGNGDHLIKLTTKNGSISIE
ncbi:MAG TPA: DUF4097 family beta strand repeat-containing protein [Bacillus sp. (in: firmicutes)]|nr:DUF4097 family beta strand repeat-containing protein [Bacillus sp. (in: firmicutes)]